MNADPRASYRPYRIIVVQRRLMAAKRLKRSTTVEWRGCAFMGWTEEQVYQEARLPSAGSFLFPGVQVTRAAAMAYFDDPRTHQVQVRTNQDRAVYVWNRCQDGSVRGYSNREE